MYKLMTPGPTMVKENVMKARSLAFTNPDLDMDFFEDYKGICDMMQEILNTENKALVLGGEGILGLEAACASLTEKGDRVLVIENGVFGRGFADFVTMYGGEAVLFSSDLHRPVDLASLEQFLEKDSNFKYATVVHCDTPSGVLNDVTGICKMLKKRGIITVVDSVAAMFGEAVNEIDGNIDILCGGSQKALSAPPGLTLLFVSEEAFFAMENRKTPIAGFYANIMLFKNYYENKVFPYTMPISDIYGLARALKNVEEDTEILQRHEKLATACRNALTEAGLSLFLETGHSNTVTVMNIPDGLTDEAIIEGIKKDYGIMIAGSFDIMAGKVIRIGHMGEGAREEILRATLEGLEGTLKKLGVKLTASIVESFDKNIANR